MHAECSPASVTWLPAPALRGCHLPRRVAGFLRWPDDFALPGPDQTEKAGTYPGPHLPFAATVFAINPAGPIDWGDLAAGAGDFDQAHFGHEFRAFTGLTPTRYVEVRRRFLREHPGHVLDSWPLPADCFLQER